MQKLYYLLFIQFFSIVSSAQNTNISGVVNVYRRVIGADSAKGLVILSDASNLTQYIGNNVMIIQMKGAVIDESNTSSFGNITDLKGAGQFEIAKICGQISDSIVFENKLQNKYDPAGLVQMVVIPKYVDVTVTGTLKSRSWDAVSGTGGVIAIEASGTVFLNAPINADSSGFWGGGLINHNSSCINFFPATNYYYDAVGTTWGHGGTKGEGISEYISGKEYGKGKQANGGGGGNNANNGGGGGSNGGVGGFGGKRTTPSCTANNPGIGGLDLTAYGYTTPNLKIFMGGGGGAGHQNNNVGMPGGHGGGVVYIQSEAINGGLNKITSNGGRPYDPTNTDPYSADSDGGGGGGGGGCIIINTNSFLGTLSIEAKGGRGSDVDADLGGQCDGPGGGGSGGVIWIKAITPPTVSINVSGGSNGVVKSPSCLNATNGATAGNIGSALTGFAFPSLKDTSPVCKTILAIFYQVDLVGILSGDKILFTSTLNAAFNISTIILQRSFDGAYFSNISTGNTSLGICSFEDIHQGRNSFYRVMVVTTDGRKVFSNILLFRGRDAEIAIGIFPQPVLHDLHLMISSNKNGRYAYQVVDVAGRNVLEGMLELKAGETRYAISLRDMVRGIYFIKVGSMVRRFVFYN